MGVGECFAEVSTVRIVFVCFVSSIFAAVEAYICVYVVRDRAFW